MLQSFLKVIAPLFVTVVPSRDPPERVISPSLIVVTDFNVPEATVRLALGAFLPDGTALVINPRVCGPVEQPTPNKGNFFLEELAKTGAGTKYQIFGQIGLDHGPEWYHAKITGLSTSFTKPIGQKVVTVSA